MFVLNTARVTLDEHTQLLLRRFGPLAQIFVHTAMMVVIQAAEGIVAEKTPIGVSANLRLSIYGRVVDEGSRVVGILGSPLVYAAPVEEGSKPHWPPIGPLRQWVHFKLGLSGGHLYAVAKVIQRQIAARGTPARRMFKAGTDHALQIAPALIERALITLGHRLSDR